MKEQNKKYNKLLTFYFAIRYSLLKIRFKNEDRIKYYLNKYACDYEVVNFKNMNLLLKRVKTSLKYKK